MKGVNLEKLQIEYQKNLENEKYQKLNEPFNLIINDILRNVKNITDFPNHTVVEEISTGRKWKTTDKITKNGSITGIEIWTPWIDSIDKLDKSELSIENRAFLHVLFIENELYDNHMMKKGNNLMSNLN